MSDEPKWYASGRGIFCRDAGFQLATMPITVNWQEDTARFVDLLNKGEAHEALERELAEAKERADLAQGELDGRGRAGCDFCAAVPTTPIPICRNCFDDHHKLRGQLTRSEARGKEQRSILVDARKWIEAAAHEIECSADDDHDDGCPAAFRHGIMHRIDAALAPDGGEDGNG